MNQILNWINQNNQLVMLLTFVCVLFWLIDSFNHESYRNYTPFGSDLLIDGYYVIRGSRNNLYCTDDANGLICNQDFAGPHETFLIQSLGKGQYALQSTKNNLWCSHTTTGVRCTAPIVGDWEVFNIKHLGKRKYSIQSNRNKQYCSDSGHGWVCDVPTMYGWEFQMFEFIKVPFENIK